MPRKAFTLVELLVVIAIIGLLSTVAVVAVSNSRVKETAVIRPLGAMFGYAYFIHAAADGPDMTQRARRP